MRLNQEKKLNCRRQNKYTKRHKYKRKITQIWRVILNTAKLFLQKVSFLFSRRFLRKAFVVILVFAWLFSGFPAIWKNPRIPPKIEEAKAADTGYNPAAGNVDGGWIAETNAYSDDTNNATLTGTTGTSKWTTFGLGSEIPGDADITAISVHIQCESTQVQGKRGDLTDIELSWDGGTSWTSTANIQSDCVKDLDTDYYFSDTTGDLWGRTWTVSDFSDANFQIRVTGDASEKATIVLGIDIIQVKVTYTSGSITADIVDGSYVSVGSPIMAMNTSTFSFICQTVTGSFGTASEQIYVNNNNGANNGWTLTLAAQATTNIWDSTGVDYDFNDPTGSGCTDGGDTDGVGGQMTVDPSIATLAVGQCGACSTANVSKGSSSAFNEGTTDTITLLTATAASDDVGDWTLRGVSISQKIPVEQPAASDYDINMVLTVAAN